MGVDERLQRLGAVRPVSINAWQRRLAQRFGGRFDFPKKLLGFGVAEVVKVFEIDDV